MAIVKSNYEFLYIDVGKQGRISDGGVLEMTLFYRKLKNGTLNLSDHKENDEELHFVFIGDEAFALHKHLLKPCSQRDLTYERRIFNCRIARTLNIVQNAFGLIASVFRVLHTSINVQPHKINCTVLAICVLRNFLIEIVLHMYNSLTFYRENSNKHEWNQEPGGIVMRMNSSIEN
jgi:hypothetical protein